MESKEVLQKIFDFVEANPGCYPSQVIELTMPNYIRHIDEGWLSIDSRAYHAITDAGVDITCSDQYAWGRCYVFIAEEEE